MTKTERISDLRRAAERLGSRASTVRGIAAALRGHCALGHFGYGVRPIRRTSRAAYYRAAHQERADRYFGTKAEGACIAARLIPRDERCTLDRLGVGTYGRTCYARQGATRRAATLALWQSAEIYAEHAEQAICAPLARGLTDHWPLRRAGSRWAGGEHTVCVRMLRPRPDAVAQLFGTASGKTEKVWSANGKWSGYNSYAGLYVTDRALAVAPTLRTLDGLILLDAIEVGPREYRARWVRQSRGVGLATQDGWLIRGYHSTRSSLVAARAEALEARSLAARALQRRHADVRDAATVFVDVADSVRGGNCQQGTEQYARQLWDRLGASGPCAIRGDIILRDRDDVFARRALGAATQRA